MLLDTAVWRRFKLTLPAAVAQLRLSRTSRIAPWTHCRKPPTSSTPVPLDARALWYNSLMHNLYKRSASVSNGWSSHTQHACTTMGPRLRPSARRQDHLCRVQPHSCTASSMRIGWTSAVKKAHFRLPGAPPPAQTKRFLEALRWRRMWTSTGPPTRSPASMAAGTVYLLTMVT